MPNQLKNLSAAVSLTVAGFCAPGAFADIAEVVTEQGDVMTFEYEGNLVRVNTAQSQQGGYMVLRDGKMYVVNYNEGQPMVFDMGEALQMFGGMADSATPSTARGEVISLKATGRSETLGGIRGEVYELHFIDDEGKETREEMVLSDDPRALGFRDAIQNMVETMARAVDQERYKQQIEAGKDMQKELLALNKGVLRYGRDMQVRSIKDTTVGSERFALPAEPTDISALIGGAFGNARQSGAQTGSSSSGSTSGILGSIFGGGSKEQPKEPPPKQEEEDKSIGTSIGESIGKAVGNIFGK